MDEITLRQKVTEGNWTAFARRHLVGKTVRSVSYATEEETESLGWHARTLVIEFDDGTLIFPSQDDEGNGPGTLFGNDPDGECLTFPVI
tara:strand:- start:17416 stop:17682 length:267 start_codon:yes stop_codon:yes gene_type:complete